MAARRLIAILLVLLFLSSLAAALAPVQQTGKSVSTTDSEPSTTAPAPSPPTLPGAVGVTPRVIEQSIDTSSEKTPAIQARTGDRLRLRVTSREPGTVELAGIGPAEDVGPQQPAFFDVLLREQGTYRVQFLGTGREIARIEVSDPEAPAPPR